LLPHGQSTPPFAEPSPSQKKRMSGGAQSGQSTLAPEEMLIPTPLMTTPVTRPGLRWMSRSSPSKEPAIVELLLPPDVWMLPLPARLTPPGLAGNPGVGSGELPLKEKSRVTLTMNRSFGPPASVTTELPAKLIKPTHRTLTPPLPRNVAVLVHDACVCVQGIA